MGMDCVISTRLTEKNRIYLERLGFLDRRSGLKRRADRKSISKFVNLIITRVLEQANSPVRGIASPEQLAMAWKQFQVSQFNQQIIGLEKDRQDFLDSFKREEYRQAAKEQLKEAPNIW